MISKQYIRVLLITTFIFGCSNPSDEELKIINTLNRQYKNYTFTHSKDLIGKQLKIFQNNPVIDSLELMSIYDSSIVKYSGKGSVSWTYLSVHDNNGKYLCTISKDKNQEYSFFRGNED